VCQAPGPGAGDEVMYPVALQEAGKTLAEDAVDRPGHAVWMDPQFLGNRCDGEIGIEEQVGVEEFHYPRCDFTVFF